MPEIAQDVVLETVEQKAVANHEVQRFINYYRIEVADTALAATPECRAIQAAITTLNVLKFWAVSRVWCEPGTELPTDDSRQIDIAKTCDAESSLLKILIQHAQRITRECDVVAQADGEKPTEDEVADFTREIVQTMSQLAIPTEELDYVTLFTVRKPEDLYYLAYHLREVFHEVNNTITPIKGFAQLATQRAEIRPRMVQFLLENVPKVNLVTDGYIESISSDHQEKDELGSREIKNMFCQYLYPYCASLGIEPTFAISDSLGDVRVNYSEFWLSGLLVNIAHNTKNSYDSMKTLRPDGQVLYIMVGLSTDGRSLVMRFEDRGIGFVKPETVEYGFRKAKEQGVHGYGSETIESNGIGMARHQEAIEDVYGGRLIPQQVTDEKGKVIGARVILSLPVKNAN